MDFESSSMVILIFLDINLAHTKHCYVLTLFYIIKIECFLKYVF